MIGNFKMGVNVGILWICIVIIFMAIETMGVRVPRAAAPMDQISERHNILKKNRTRSRPIDYKFKLPITQTSFLEGNGFGQGTIIDLGDLHVTQVSTFSKVWGVYEGGPDDQGASVYEPTRMKNGFSVLGSYSQPNNKPLFGYFLVAKDVTTDTTKNATLMPPVDYTLVANTASVSDNQDSTLYIWQPTPRDGYKAVGQVVTTTPDKPSTEKVMCVRSDLTEQCETSSQIWGSNDINFYDVRPSNRGVQAPGIRIGSFIVQSGGNTNPPAISCLKNLNSISQIMPNQKQIEELLQSYSPFLYLHPDEEYLPSSVNWFFSNGALLYKKGDESNPVPVAQNGTNLPQDHNNDGAYWIDLPADDENKDRVKQGNIESAESYVHVKPMYGGTFTDIAMWVFYPFNGAGRAKVEFINVKLGKVGEHVGDWEHVTLRVSNFDGQLWQVYFSQHSKGEWIDSSQLEFLKDTSNFDFPTRRPVVYASLHGHANYPHAGLVLQGKDGVGARDDTDKSDNIMDLGKFVLVSADYLGSQVIEPAWLNFFREWGPHVDFKLDDELKGVDKLLPGKLKDVFEKIIMGLPKEILGEEGPTGPKEKGTWNGDEV